MAYSTLKRFLRKENNRWTLQRALRVLQDSAEVLLKLLGLELLLLYNVDEVLSTESDKSGFKLSVGSYHAITFVLVLLRFETGRVV